MEMFLTFKFVLELVTILIWPKVGYCCSKGLLIGSADTCCLDYYKDDTFCKECQSGYFGINCSEECKPPAYGVRCSQTCDNCSSCNHIHGCKLFRETFESTTTHDNISDNYQQTPKSIHDTGKSVIIFTGSVISLVLIAMIIREICTYRRMSNSTGLNKASDGSYENIVISFENSFLSCPTKFINIV